MKNKNNFLIAGVVVLVLGIVYVWMTGTDEGKVYPSKEKLCQHFAQSYLQTIGKQENITDFNGEKWQMAVDVETDLYNICLLDLNEDVLKNYRPSAIEKYKDGQQN